MDTMKMFCFAVLGVLLTSTLIQAAPKATYRCWSYNVGQDFTVVVGDKGKTTDTAALRCTSPALKLNQDGTYQLGSEKGTYKIENQKLVLSQSKIRGAGSISGNKIVFNYPFQGKKHTMTYLLQSGSLAAKSSRAAAPSMDAGEREPASVPKIIERVDLILDFSSSDASVGWINSTKLISTDGEVEAESIAYQDEFDKTKIKSNYHEKLKSGHVYKVYVSSGFGSPTHVGTVDLRTAEGTVKKTIPVTPTW